MSQMLWGQFMNYVPQPVLLAILDFFWGGYIIKTPFKLPRNLSDVFQHGIRGHFPMQWWTLSSLWAIGMWESNDEGEFDKLRKGVAIIDAGGVY
ncbi:hypothetical protein DAMA08_038330 [Martiniozyma asiatica (nom. inval.)]|nr:hypothetical protein DAMA08_038330 [Martiniozyma asiatica]